MNAALLLAHCGANWKWCDGGSAATAIMLLVGVLWAGKRAERKKHARREEHLRRLEAAGVLENLVADHRSRGAAQPQDRRPPVAQSRGTRKKR